MSLLDSGSTARLLCVGDLNLDITVTAATDLAIGSDTAGTIEMAGGGSAANVAAWAVRAGVDSTFIGAIGDDDTGAGLVDELDVRGVTVRPVRRDHAASSKIAAIVGPDRNRSLVTDLDANVALDIDDYRGDWLDDIAWLHLTAYSFIATRTRSLFVHLRQQARRRGIPVSIDPSAAQLLRSECTLDDVLIAFNGAAVLVPSHDEAEYLTGRSDPAAAAAQLLGLADCVAVTCGERGVHIAERRSSGDVAACHVPAQRVQVVNTLGCGDAFAAGFIAGRLGGLDAAASARSGVELASEAAQLAAAR